MLKFNRNYKCTIEIGERKGLADFIPQNTFTIDSKITLVFSITRNMFAETNNAILRFYNLAPELQAKLWKDPYQETKYVKVTLNAGYGVTMPRVFIGLATKCSTYKEGGGLDYITEIEANDAAFLMQYGFCNMTLVKGTSFKNFLNTMLSDYPDCNVGYVTDKIEGLKTNTAYIGQPMDILQREYGKYQIFIDNGEIHVLDKNDVIPTESNYVITANSGLLGSPRRSDTTVELDMIFEPGLIVGQKVEVLSDSVPWLNNTYKLIGLEHKGVISPVVNGILQTHLILSLGSQILNDLKREKRVENIVSNAKSGWIRPVSDRITGNYGEQRSTHSHKGIDYGCPIGTQIKAAHDGIVSTAGNVSGFGLAIYINHGLINGNRVVSIYGHLSQINVVPNQRIKMGDIIGLSGNTGRSTGPHLHFQINENNLAVNPNKYIGGN